MARSKTWAILDKNRTNAWLNNMIGYNRLISEWKETLDCLKLPLTFFRRHFVSLCRGNNQLVNHFIMNVVQLSPWVSGQESQYPFNVNSKESEYSKIGESGNIYESGKISSGLNPVSVASNFR